MAHSYRCVCMVRTIAPAETCLRIEEVIFLIDIQELIHPLAISILYETVVDTISLIVNVTILHISERTPIFGKAVGSLQVCTGIKLLGIGVVVLMLTVAQVALSEFFVLDVCDISEVIALELLYGEAAYDVPVSPLIIHIAHCSISILLQSLLPYKI